MLQWKSPSGEIVQYNRQQIGVGTFGTVHTGVFRDRAVAVKCVRCSCDLAPFLAEEIRIMTLMEHANIMSIIESYTKTIDNVAISVIVMPLARFSIQHLIAAHAPMSPKQCAFDISSALEHVHNKGFVHLDVTTMNILVGPNDTYILTDFGVSRAIGAPCAANSVTNEACRAPELHEDFVASPRSDMWSLACVVTEMIESAGHVPFMFHTAITGSLAHKLVLGATFSLPCNGIESQCVCNMLSCNHATCIWKDRGLCWMVSHCWQIDLTARCTASHALKLLHTNNI